MKRSSWLPFVCSACGALLGIGAAQALFWWRVSAGAYEGYPGFVGLKIAAGQEFLLLVLGVWAGVAIGYVVSESSSSCNENPSAS